jgi:hypothetical protein
VALLAPCSAVRRSGWGPAHLRRERRRRLGPAGLAFVRSRDRHLRRHAAGAFPWRARPSRHRLRRRGLDERGLPPARDAGERCAAGRGRRRACRAPGHAARHRRGDPAGQRLGSRRRQPLAPGGDQRLGRDRRAQRRGRRRVHAGGGHLGTGQLHLHARRRPGGDGNHDGAPHHRGCCRRRLYGDDRRRRARRHGGSRCDRGRRRQRPALGPGRGRHLQGARRRCRFRRRRWRYGSRPHSRQRLERCHRACGAYRNRSHRRRRRQRHAAADGRRRRVGPHGSGHHEHRAHRRGRRQRSGHRFGRGRCHQRATRSA